MKLIPFVIATGALTVNAEWSGCRDMSQFDAITVMNRDGVPDADSWCHPIIRVETTTGQSAEFNPSMSGGYTVVRQICIDSWDKVSYIGIKAGCTDGYLGSYVLRLNRHKYLLEYNGQSEFWVDGDQDLDPCGLGMNGFCELTARSIGY